MQSVAHGTLSQGAAPDVASGVRRTTFLGLRVTISGMHDELLRRAAVHADTYLQDIRDRHVAATLTGEELRTMLSAPLAEEGSDPHAVIDALARAGRNGTVATQGPRYFGFVIGGSAPAATAADWLVSAWDQNACVFVMSPLAAVVEQIVAGWVTGLVGLPSSWSVTVMFEA